MNEPLYKISPPKTNGDDGSPSKSCLKDARRIFRLIEDERHLCAHSLYESLIERLAKPVDPPSPPHKFRLRRPVGTKSNRLEQSKDAPEAKELLDSKTAILEKLVVSAGIFLKDPNVGRRCRAL
jgi:hypothetical protein